MTPQSTASCSWCGAPVERDDGWRVEELPGERRAAFCRLEHVVPWEIQGAHWEAGEIEEPIAKQPARPAAHDSGGVLDASESCAHCGEPLGEVRVVAVRHRGEHRIPDGFCSATHLAAWAKAGGRWQ